jgi:ribonuclease Z
MEHHNALRQTTLRLDSLTIAGFSIAGLATYVQVPELDACFDLGECPLSALPLNHVFLTHAHGDHARCLPRHWQLRRMLGMVRDARYFLPESIRATGEAWVRAEAGFEGVPEAEVVTPPFEGLRPGDVVQLGRKDLRVRAFPVVHRVPSLGYTLLMVKRKLKPELAGRPGPELARLRQEGAEIQDEVVEPRLTFIGDCIGQSLFDEAHIWDSPVLLLEATFLGPGEEELAARKGHTHLHEIAAALEHFGERVRCRHIILKHFSMRYTVDEIRAHVDRAIPPAFRPRIELLLRD